MSSNERNSYTHLYPPIYDEISYIAGLNWPPGVLPGNTWEPDDQSDFAL